MRRVVTCLFLVAYTGLAMARDEESKRWIGKTVVVLKNGAPILGNNDKQIGVLDATTIRALRVQGTRIWVRDPRGQEGWVAAEVLVPLDEALALFTRRIKDDPKDEVSFYLRAMTHREFKDYAKAVEDLNEAVKLNATSHVYRLGRAVVLEKMQEYGRAVEDLTKVIELNPNYTYGYFFRGQFHYNRGEYAKAIPDFDEAIRRDSSFPAFYHWRATAKLRLKEYAEALKDEREACRLDPRFETAFRQATWLLASCPVSSVRDGKAAVIAGKRSCDLTDWKSAASLDAYAAALAEAGSFEEAIQWATKAVQLAASDDEKNAIGSRLALYRNKTPYRG